MSNLRTDNPALRYGRQYFRACSGNGCDFGYSPYPGGILAYSRILNDREVLIVANTSINQEITVHVIVDANLNPVDKVWCLLFATEPNPVLPEKTQTHGIFRTVKVKIGPMGAQILG